MPAPIMVRILAEQPQVRAKVMPHQDEMVAGQALMQAILIIEKIPVVTAEAQLTQIAIVQALILTLAHVEMAVTRVEVAPRHQVTQTREGTITVVLQRAKVLVAQIIIQMEAVARNQEARLLIAFREVRLLLQVTVALHQVVVHHRAVRVVAEAAVDQDNFLVRC